MRKNFILGIVLLINSIMLNVFGLICFRYHKGDNSIVIMGLVVIVIGFILLIIGVANLVKGLPRRVE